jgi:integrase
MASLSHSKGRYLVYTRQQGGKRHPIRLGRVAARVAGAVLDHVEALEAAKRTDTQLPGRTLSWLEGIDDVLHARLAKSGLVSARQYKAMPLGVYFKTYIDRRTDLKAGTRRVLGNVKDTATALLGADRDMRAVTVGDVEDYHRALITKYARATAAMHIKKMRQVWSDAIKRKLLTENPFKAVKAGSMANKSREVYVPAADVDKVIDYCTDHEWKLIFALARYGGLRVPSEIKALRWADIHFDSQRMIVRSPKTEHHQGHESREIPIFPELEPLLTAAFIREDRHDVYVIKSKRGSNLATTGRKLIERAGVKTWGKLWNNLRSSRETDLAARFPIHVVCAWIGNSVSVAMKHYLQVTDDHFADAISDSRLDAVTQGDAGKASISSHGRRVKRSLQEDSSLRNDLENLQNAHRAVQNALHSRQRHLTRWRSRVIRGLTRMVCAARSGGAA